MRNDNVIFSAVQLFVVLFCLSLGGFCLMIAYSPAVRLFFENVMIHQYMIFSRIGFGIVCFGLILLIFFLTLNRKKYLTFKMHGSKTLIDGAIIRDYLKCYWKEVFPQHEIMYELVLHLPQKIEIIVELPNSFQENREMFLRRIENELSVLLSRKLGYDEEFLLTVRA